MVYRVATVPAVDCRASRHWFVGLPAHGSPGVAFLLGSLACTGCAADFSGKPFYCQAGGFPTPGRVWWEWDGGRWYRVGVRTVVRSAPAVACTRAPATCIAVPLALLKRRGSRWKRVARLLNPATVPQIAELRVRVRIKPWLHGWRMSHNAKQAPFWSGKSSSSNRPLCTRWCCSMTTTLRWSL